MGEILVIAFVFMSLSSLTVLNMLVGVLCDVVSEVAGKERVERATTMASERMKGIAEELDEDFNGKISYNEFSRIMEKPEALQTLEDVGVNPVAIVDFAELFFVENGCSIELPFDQFMEMVMDLRETNTAKVKDVMNTWMQIKMSTNRDIKKLKQALNSKTESLERQVSAILNEVRKISSSTQGVM